MGRMKERGMDAQQEAEMKTCTVCGEEIEGYPEWCSECLCDASREARESGLQPWQFYESLPLSMQTRVREMMFDNGIPSWHVTNKGRNPDDEMQEGDRSETAISFRDGGRSASKEAPFQTDEDETETTVH